MEQSDDANVYQCSAKKRIHGVKMIVHTNDIVIARWKDRFFAWLIDFAIVSAGIGIVSSVSNHFGHHMQAEWYVTTSAIFFVYWVLLECHSGQSLGKRLLHLKTIKADGTSPSLLDSVANSFGKAFLLPLDVVLGLIFTDKKRQRIFSRLSNTIVVKLEPENEEIPYRLD